MHVKNVYLKNKINHLISAMGRHRHFQVFSKKEKTLPSLQKGHPKKEFAGIDRQIVADCITHQLVPARIVAAFPLQYH